MNAETAETLFRCHRPGKPSDSRTQKAVKFAEQDPELQKKLSEQIAFDEQIVEVIHAIAPPENLRQKLSALGAQPGAEKTKLRKHIINPAVLTAILGGIVLLGVIGFLVKESMEKFPGRPSVEGLLGNAAKMNPADIEPISTTMDQLGDVFLLRGYEGYEVPPELAKQPVIGYRLFHYDNRSVAMTVLDDKLFYEFHGSDVQPPEGNWLVLTKDQWVGAVRKHGDHCFVLAFRGTKADMHAFLQSLPKK
jgi:hypothetical protein